LANRSRIKARRKRQKVAYAVVKRKSAKRNNNF